MKRIFTTLLLAAITLFACQTVSAYRFKVDGIYYDFGTVRGTAIVTLDYTYSYDYKRYTGDVVIPSSVIYGTDTLIVTEIGNTAFQKCTTLSSVTIPNSVKKIGRRAFEGCTSLSSVEIPNSVTVIDELAFSDCTSLSSVTNSHGVTAIGKGAFSGCTSLSYVTIPNGVTMIWDDVFKWCTSLSSVTIPNSVTKILGRAFEGCTSLSSVTIPNSVTDIGYSAFSGCTSLSTVVLSDSLSYIDAYAFRDCSQLTSINIPASVRSIEKSVFHGCNNLQKLIFEDSNQTLRVFSSYLDTYASNLYPTFLYLGRTIDDIGLMNSDEIETLVFGKMYISKKHPRMDKVKTIISKIEEPYDIDPFLDSTYINATLYVPKGTKALYESTDGWRQFFNIQEGDPTTGIVSAKDDVNKVEVSRYDIKGQRLNAPRKGINIVRYSDGTTEKIVVR